MEAVAKIYASKGRMMGITFCYRSKSMETSQLRKMNCRLKGSHTSNFSLGHGLINVIEVNAPKGKNNGWKSIPWEGLSTIAMDGERYYVVHGKTEKLKTTASLTRTARLYGQATFNFR